MYRKLNNLFIYLICLYVITMPLLPGKYHIGKLPVNGDALLFLIFGLYVLFIIVNREFRNNFLKGITVFFKSKTNIFAALWILAMVISIAFAGTKTLAVKETIRFGSYVLLYFIISIEAHDKEKSTLLIRTYLVTCFIVFAAGIYEFLDYKFILHDITSSYRLVSVLENSNNIAVFAIILFFPVLSLLLSEKRLSRRIMYALLLLMALFNIVMSESRNSLIALCLGILIFSILYNRKLAVIFLVIAVPLGAIFLGHSRITKVFDSAQNLSRIKIWTATIGMIEEKPIMGIGNGNFPVVYDKYIDTHPDLNYDGNRFNHPHNIFLKAQLELGIFGTIALTGFLVFLIISLFKYPKILEDRMLRIFAQGFAVSFIVFLCTNLIDNFFSAPKVFTYIWVILGVFQAQKINVFCLTTGNESENKI